MPPGAMAHLCFLLPDMRGGGAERVALTLIQSFVSRGHQVDLVLGEAEGPLLEELPASVRVFDLKADRMRQAILPFVRYLKQRRPGAVQVSMWPLTIVGIVGRMLAGSDARIVVSDHVNLSTHFAHRPKVLRFLRWSTRLLYPRADSRVCVSAGVADDLARVSGIDRDMIEVIHNPIPSRPQGSGEEAQAHWTGRERRILAVGALKEEKDHALLLRAFALLNAAEPANLLILGEGALRDDLQAMVRELGLADRVAMPGFAVDPTPYYASAHLFALTSRNEGFGNVVVEALQRGLPIVSTDTDGPREILERGAFGTLVPHDRPDALAAAIDEALTSPPPPERQKRRSRDFQPEIAADRYLRLMGVEANVGPFADVAAPRQDR